jgi:light-regulated signal transduction histidine kinase (bacteriophytochrome)
MMPPWLSKKAEVTMIAREFPNTRQGMKLQDPETVITLLQSELSTTNQEVMLLTLELEQRVAARTSQLSLINQELTKEVVDRRSAEEEVRRLNEDLKHRAQLLQEANEALEAFSSSISHDLRGPLSHIIGFVSILEMESDTILSDKGRAYLEKIKLSARSMSNLIDELLRFSRFAHAELHREYADLDAIVDSVMDELEPEIKGRNIEWKRAHLPSVLCDVPLMRQVFANMISNALKYTRRRDVTEIEIGFQIREPGEVIYLIRDNGVGFDPQQADKLFGVFKRLHKSEDFEGTGVGLANVRRIISRHGGRTWAESQPGEGATFYFTLPNDAVIEEVKKTA